MTIREKSALPRGFSYILLVFRYGQGQGACHVNPFTCFIRF